MLPLSSKDKQQNRREQMTLALTVVFMIGMTFYTANMPVDECKRKRNILSDEHADKCIAAFKRGEDYDDECVIAEGTFDENKRRYDALVEFLDDKKQNGWHAQSKNGPIKKYVTSSDTGAAFQVWYNGELVIMKVMELEDAKTEYLFDKKADNLKSHKLFPVQKEFGIIVVAETQSIWMEVPNWVKTLPIMAKTRYNVLSEKLSDDEKVVEILGTGTSGAVFGVWNEEEQKKYAMKLVEGLEAAQDEYDNHREILKKAGDLKHLVVGIHGDLIEAEHGGKYYGILRLDHMNNGDLLHSVHIFEDDEELPLFNEVLKVLERLHEAGIVLMHLHLRNFLVHIDDEGKKIIKLADFDHMESISDLLTYRSCKDSQSITVGSRSTRSGLNMYGRDIPLEWFGYGDEEPEEDDDRSCKVSRFIDIPGIIQSFIKFYVIKNGLDLKVTTKTEECQQLFGRTWPNYLCEYQLKKDQELLLAEMRKKGVNERMVSMIENVMPKPGFCGPDYEHGGVSEPYGCYDANEANLRWDKMRDQLTG